MAESHRKNLRLIHNRFPLKTLGYFHKYNHLLVTNPKNNQLEFFPSEYRNEIELLVRALIPSHPTESLEYHRYAH